MDWLLRSILLSALMLLLPAVLQTVSAQSPSLADASAVPFLSLDNRDNYRKFLQSAGPKAFAIARDGAWSWRTAPTVKEAKSEAIAACGTYTPYPCEVYAVNGEVVWHWGKETPAERRTRELAPLQKVNLSRDAFALEDQDYGIASTGSLNDNYHSPTPIFVPGAKTISTGALVRLLLSPRAPIVVDALEGDIHGTVPTAIWLKGAGIVGSHVDDKAAASFIKIAPDRQFPIVFLCLSSECWLSYNATLRALRFGYSNVYWYRGGVEAWRAAGLPMPKSVLAGTLE